MPRTPAQIAADEARAAILRTFGMHNSRRIVQEARQELGNRVALAAAMVEQESTNGENVVGHDRDARGNLIFPARNGKVKVTEDLYRRYKVRRDVGGKGRGGMQGFGPMQLTYWSIQDDADRNGGCWKPRINIRTGFRHLNGLIETHGLREGVRRYNGSGPAAERYADSVMAKRAKWRKRLFVRGEG